MEPLRQKEEGKIELRHMIGVLMSRIWIIIFSGMVVGLLALIFTKVMTTPTYTSSTKIYVLNKDDKSSDVTSGDLALSATLAKDYAQLITSRNVTESVVSELGLNMNGDALARKITVEMPGDSRIITISVTDVDPYLASKIVTSVRDTAAIHIKEVMNSQAVNVVEEANIPQSQTTFAYKRNGGFGILAGIAIAVGIILLGYMFNDTIKCPEDVEKYVGLSVLGSIPLTEDDKKADGIRKHRKSTERRIGNEHDKTKDEKTGL